MKVLVTGGGTGGHVYPALEVAKGARLRGHEVSYWGSFRGQESAACQLESIPFVGFASEPVYRLASPKGVLSAFRLARASAFAVRMMRQVKPDIVFGTGGYSSAPVMMAARKLRVKHVIHEQNSVPGRTQLLAARTAQIVCTVFLASESRFSGASVVRTGMPVRPVFRQVSGPRQREVFVTGGSQGSNLLNSVVGQAVVASGDRFDWVHVLGKGNAAAIESHNYQPYSFLTGEEMAKHMARCKVCLSRSGAGAIAELVTTRTPSILVPYRFAFGNHQLVNARELETLGVARVIREEEFNKELLMEAVEEATEPSAEQIQAFEDWDRPDATERILKILEGLD